MNRVDPSQLKKLRWRCRRGMRELDAMLEAYISRLQHTMPAHQEQAFASLLDSEDDQLWDWLSGRELCPDANLRTIIDDIRTTD